jgi:hypothetical protein
MIFLLVAAAVVVAAPLVAALLVTVASLREDSARTLTGRPPGLITAAARRLCLRTGDSALRPRANSPPDTHDLDFMNQVYPYLPQPRPAADEDAADHTLTLPRA